MRYTYAYQFKPVKSYRPMCLLSKRCWPDMPNQPDIPKQSGENTVLVYICVCVCVCMLPFLFSSCVHFYKLIHHVAQGEEKSGTSLSTALFRAVLAFISRIHFSVLHPWQLLWICTLGSYCGSAPLAVTVDILNLCHKKLLFSWHDARLENTNVKFQTM